MFYSHPSPDGLYPAFKSTRGLSPPHCAVALRDEDVRQLLSTALRLRHGKAQSSLPEQLMALFIQVGRRLRRRRGGARPHARGCMQPAGVCVRVC